MKKFNEMIKKEDIIAKSGKVVYIKENVSFLKDTKIIDDAAPLIIEKKKTILDNNDDEETEEFYDESCDNMSLTSEDVYRTIY